MSRRWRNSPTGIVLFALFAPALLLVTWLRVLPHAAEQARSLGWPSTPGVVTRSEYRGLSRSGTSMRLEYTYRVGGRTHRGERYRADSNFEWDRRQIVAEHPVGAAVAVYYDPGNPARAVLDPGLSFAAALGAAAILALTAGVTAFAWWRVHRMVRCAPTLE